MRINTVDSLYLSSLKFKFLKRIGKWRERLIVIKTLSVMSSVIETCVQKGSCGGTIDAKSDGNKLE